MSPSPAPQHRCTTCQKDFSRLEHLQRHRQTHSGSKPFRCRFCTKAFSRKDAAHRHEQIRHEPGNRGEAAVSPMRRACLACSDARIWCSGGTPCANCHAKARECVYARDRRLLSSATDDGRPALDAGFSHNVLSNAGGGLGGARVEGAQGFAEGLQATRSQNARSGNPPRGSTAFPAQPQNGGAGRTPVNWLPFDAFTPPEQAEMRLSNENSRSYHASLGLPNSNPNGFSAGGTMSQQDWQTRTPQSDSLNSLIASMGRASRAFGHHHFPSLMATGDAVVYPAGSLYSDGAGGRSSQAERAMHKQHAQRERSSFSDHPVTLDSEGAWLHSLETSLREVPEPDDARLYRIPANIYGDIIAKLESRVPWPSSSSTFGLSSHNFLAKDTLDRFVRLYFEHFQPIYPFLDLPLLNMPIWGWSLCLATAAVGCHYSDHPAKDICGDALSVILRELLVHELQICRVECTLSYLQASLLNTLALCQSENANVVALGEEAISSVMNSCKRFCLLDEPDWGLERSVQIQGDVNQMWTAWRCREMRRRTGLFAWSLDCSLAFIHTASPVLNLQSLNLMLPCKEKLWEADSAPAWYRAYSPRAQKPLDSTIFAAEEEGRILFRTIFVELFERLELVESMSQFATLGCIYALFHRHWDLIRHFQAPLSISRDDGVHHTSHGLVATAYPPAIADFTRWRNKACDYMDVLHWEALGESAKAGGWEGPIFLKLHLARLILLAPVKELLTLAEELIPDGRIVQLPHNVAWQRKDLTRCRQVVSTWAQADRYKARLVVVHAGATFWHIRRYASNSFVQPFTLYLAAIALFFFARLSMAAEKERQITSNMPLATATSEEPNPIQLENSEGSNRSSNYSHSPEDVSIHSPSDMRPQHQKQPRMPANYHIDRPVDDELVQHFVRYGEASTKLCAEGIDNLCSTGGAKAILLEAAALLETGNVVWPLARKYAMVLRLVAAEEGKVASVV